MALKLVLPASMFALISPSNGEYCPSSGSLSDLFDINLVKSLEIRNLISVFPYPFECARTLPCDQPEFFHRLWVHHVAVLQTDTNFSKDIKSSHFKNLHVFRHQETKFLVYTCISQVDYDLVKESLAIITATRMSKRNRDYYMFYSNANPLQNLPSSKGISFFKHVVTIGFENSSLVAFKQHCFISRKVEATPFEGKLYHQCETDLDGFTLSVSLSTDGPEKQVQLVNGSLEPFKTGGASLRCLLEVGKLMNFTTKIEEASGGGGTGRKSADGSWNGVVGDVYNGRTSLGLMAGFTPERLQSIDICSPFDYVNAVILHAPAESFVSWQSLFRVFSIPVWISAGAGIVFTSAFLHVLLKLPQCGDSCRKPSTVSRVGFGAIPTSTNCGSAAAAAAYIICWHFFITIIATAYVSKLFEIFLMPSAGFVPKDFDQLATSDYDIGITYGGGLLYTYFETSKMGSSTYNVFKRMAVMNVNACITAALQKQFACITFDKTSNHFLNTHFMKSNGKLPRVVVEYTGQFQTYGSIATEKDSVLKESLDRILQMIFHSGILDVWSRQTEGDMREEYRNQLEHDEANEENVDFYPPSKP